MELIRCPNCLSVYGDLQDECPQCEADSAGEGGRIEFDGTARSAIASLGGVYGGILDGPGEQVLLWCEHGVCLYDPMAGLVWKSAGVGKVENVALATDVVRVQARGREIELDLADGNPL